MTHVTFYFDYRSPYAYLAQSQLRHYPADIDYRPFDIRAAMETVGNVPTSVICKAKNRYVQADLRRWIARYAVPFQRHPEILKLDTERLLRTTLWAAERGPIGELVSALFAALWGQPEPLGAPSDISRILKRIGINGEGFEAEVDEPRWRDAVAGATAQAAERGVFGAPCMFVGDEMFFGNDRLDFVRAELERAA